MRRAAAIVVIAGLVIAVPAGAEPLPSGSMGVVVGAAAGTGPDANRLGVGYSVYPFSFQAAWQPMDSERRMGWSVRWTTIFTAYEYAGAAQLADLETMAMDLTLGARVRPGKSPRRYLTARVGPGIVRANQTIPPKMQRAFFGGVGSVGLQQYLVGTLLLLDFDVRYGLVGGSGPTGISFTFGLSINGP